MGILDILIARRQNNKAPQSEKQFLQQGSQRSGTFTATDTGARGLAIQRELDRRKRAKGGTKATGMQPGDVSADMDSIIKGKGGGY